MLSAGVALVTHSWSRMTMPRPVWPETKQFRQQRKAAKDAGCLTVSAHRDVTCNVFGRKYHYNVGARRITDLGRCPASGDSDKVSCDELNNATWRKGRTLTQKFSVSTFHQLALLTGREIIAKFYDILHSLETVGLTPLGQLYDKYSALHLSLNEHKSYLRLMSLPAIRDPLYLCLALIRQHARTRACLLVKCNAEHSIKNPEQTSLPKLVSGHIGGNDQLAGHCIMINSNRCVSASLSPIKSLKYWEHRVQNSLLHLVSWSPSFYRAIEVWCQPLTGAVCIRWPILKLAQCILASETEKQSKSVGGDADIRQCCIQGVYSSVAINLWALWWSEQQLWRKFILFQVQYPKSTPQAVP